MTAALALDPPPVSTRRVSAGIHAADGATSRLPAWWGRDDWIYEVSLTAAASPDVLREHHVSLDAVMATARGMAAFADFRTGRDCRPTNERLVELLRCSLSTIQRARRALKALGFVVELVRGRSILTRAERLAAWRRGSSHRQVAAEFALLSRPRRAPKRTPTNLEIVTFCGSAPASSVDGDTPPGASTESDYLQVRRGPLRRRTENEEGGCAPRSYRGPRDGRSRRLAEGVRDRLGWLRGVQAGRLAPTLAKFARQGWTPRDVDLALRDVLAARGHRVPAVLKAPAAYLASLLRELDPEHMIRPSVEQDAYEAHLKAQAAAERAARRAHLLTIAGKCPHGIPANGAGQPSRGVLACLECRR